MKKLSLIVLILMLAFFVCSCAQKENPEKSVTETLNALKLMDNKTVNKYTDYDSIIQNATVETPNSKNVDKKVASLMLKNLEFSIVSSNIENNTAFVKTKITNLDMLSISKEYSLEIINLTLSQAFASEKDKKTNNDLFCELLSKKDNKKVTNTVDIELYKENDVWKIKQNDPLIKAIYGKGFGVSNIISSMPFNK